jgi:hypothetical protein
LELHLKCKFCLKDVSKLVNSHIIPRSFFKKLTKGSEKYSLLLKVGEKKTNREFKQAGISDSTILCEKCEQLFAPFDKHGFEAITDALEAKKIYQDHLGKSCAYIAERADYQLLKLFALSILWRASVSSHFFFEKINLGIHENRIQKMIQNKDAGSTNDYSVLCFYLVKQHYPGTILPPFRCKIQNVNCCRLYLPDIMFLIKVDSRPFSPLFQRVAMKPKLPVYLAFQNYFGSPEMRFIESTKLLLKKQAGIPENPVYRYEKSS